MFPWLVLTLSAGPGNPTRGGPSDGMCPRGFEFGNPSRRDEIVRNVIYWALYKRCTIHYQPPGWKDSRLNVPLRPVTFPECVASVTGAVGTLAYSITS